MIRSRQTDILPDDLIEHITLIGCGGIGSPTALGLAKMGAKRITIYDPDTIDDTNFSSQFYTLNMLDQSKALSMEEMIKQFTDDVDVNSKDEEFDCLSKLIPGIVIVGTDSMESRRAVWEQVKDNKEVKLFIDARMGGLEGVIYAVRPTIKEHIEMYEMHMFTDDEAEPIKCTAKAIIFNTMVIAGFICSIVRQDAVERQDIRFITNIDMTQNTVF